jgi:hypothetical protein
MWELICFATLAAMYGYDRFASMASLDPSVLPAPMTAIGLFGLATLQGFSMMILAYGVLIPNTRRRSLMVVAGLFIVAIARSSRRPWSIRPYAVHTRHPADGSSEF